MECDSVQLKHKKGSWLALQEDIAQVCNIPELVDAALDGYCVTVFAFGQTGSVSILSSLCNAAACWPASDMCC